MTTFVCDVNMEMNNINKTNNIPQENNATGAFPEHSGGNEQITLKTYRYKFTDELMTEIESFAKIHQFDDRKSFKEAWVKWIDEAEIAILIQNNVDRLLQNGYVGNIMYKMFHSARFYYRKKSLTDGICKEHIPEQKIGKLKQTNDEMLKPFPEELLQTDRLSGKLDEVVYTNHNGDFTEQQSCAEKSRSLDDEINIKKCKRFSKVFLKIIDAHIMQIITRCSHKNTQLESHENKSDASPAMAYEDFCNNNNEDIRTEIIHMISMMTQANKNMQEISINNFDRKTYTFECNPAMDLQPDNQKILKMQILEILETNLKKTYKNRFYNIKVSLTKTNVSIKI